MLKSSTMTALEKYREEKGKKIPDHPYRAMAFATTEMGEAYELLLARDGGWVRNNPEKKEEYTAERFGEELGDAIAMLMFAGYVEGIDPLLSIKEKLSR
jgi:NTP pyrophosphatase (non-canonical NTP hydrolase)